MNLDEKLKYIQDVAMTQARREGNETISEYNAAIEKLYNKHKEEILAQSKQRIKSETTTVRQKLNAALSKGALKLKRELSDVQRNIKRDLFGKVRDRIDAFMQTAEYDDVLEKYILKAAHYAGDQEIRIYLNKADASKKESLEKRSGLKLEVSDEDFIGGIRAVIPERNILIDYSFQNALEREYNDYTFGGIRNV